MANEMVKAFNFIGIEKPNIKVNQMKPQTPS